MNKKKFKEEIFSILDFGKIEGIKLRFPKIIQMLVNDKEIFNSFYNEFKDNYNMIYGKDSSNYIMKLQDFIFRLDLLCSLMPNNNINDYKTVLEKSDFDLYSGISYDEDENKEILEDYSLGMKL